MMHDESGYMSFSTPPFSTAASAIDPNTSHGLLPTQPHIQSDFEIMKRSFAAATLGNPSEPRARGMTVPAHSAPSNGQIAAAQSSPPMPQGALAGYVDYAEYADVYGAANGPYGPSQVNGMYQNGYSAGPNVNAVPFMSAGHQQQALGNDPSSPYLGVTSNFGSPSSHSNGAFAPGMSQSPSFNGSNYGGQFSPNPGSPNPYSPQPHYGFGLMPQPGFLGLLPGMMAMGNGSPTSGGTLPMQQGLAWGSPTFGMGIANFIPTGQTGRTVYVGNLPADAAVDELLSQVRFGPIESVKILPEKSCAFISFLDPTTAAAFHSDAMMRKVRLHEQELKIGWGKPSAVSATVYMAVQQSNATRNVYLGNLDERTTEQTLRDDLSRFGPIDQVKIVRDKNIGFVHFLSISTAVKVVQVLSSEPEWAGRRVNYGKDRCAYVPKNQHQQQQHNLAAAALGSMAASLNAYNGLSPVLSYNGDMSVLVPGSDMPGNRTVYLGNIHPESTTEEICNTIRGGILQNIRYIPDKHICFVTFVDAQCALAFYQSASFQGIALHNRRLKVGWGKHSGPPSPGISMVVQSGGSRNVYIGNIDDFDVYNEEKLRKDFGEYGEIELVNTLQEKNAAFVNFTNIANSIKSIEGIKSHPDYAHLKIAYGKDRCGNPPRSLAFAQHTHHAPRSPVPEGLDIMEGGIPLQAIVEQGPPVNDQPVTEQRTKAETTD